MPVSIGIAITAAATAVAGAAGTAAVTATIVGGITVADVLGVVVLGALQFGLSELLKPSQSNQEQKQTVKQAVPVRRKYYGTNRVGGPYALLLNYKVGSDGWLAQVVMVNSGRSNGAVTHWLGSEQVTIDGAGNVNGVFDAQGNPILDDHGNPTNRYYRSGKYYAIIETRLGTDDQTAYDSLVSLLPSGTWTSDHRLLGISTAAIRLLSPPAQSFTEIYPYGLPTYNQTMQGSPVWDPRDPSQHYGDPSTWLFTDNAALVILDYVTSNDGMRLGFGSVLSCIDDWKHAADVCDQLVTRADGSTEKRYKLSFGYDLTQAPKDVLPPLLLACDGWLFTKADGSISLQVGEWIDPTVTLDDSIITSVQLQRGNGPLRLANEIRATFVDPTQAYQNVEAQPWDDEADISARGDTITKQVDLGMLQSENAARRIMKIAMFRANPRWTGTITTNFGGLNAIGERRVTLVYGRRKINETVEITSGPKIDLQARTLTFGVSSMSSAAYDFDADTEEGTAGTGGSDALMGGGWSPTPSSRSIAPTVGTSVAISMDDHYVGIRGITAAVNITLPSPAGTDQEVVIKDEDGSCSATNPINVGTIDGSAVTLTIPFSWVKIKWRPATSTWTQVS